MKGKKPRPEILIVDDSPFDLQLVSWVLKGSNYHTIEANNGEEALGLLKSKSPDLILLDIIMPGFDGFDICREIKKQESLKDIPVIFFTTLKNTQDIVKGFELGGIDFITKPFNKEELVVRVKNHIDLINSKRQLEMQKEELIKANSLKDKMFNIIAHDLRSPLGSVKLVIDSLRLGIIEPGGELFKETIDELSKTTNEANVLLENLLGWARSQTNTLKVIPEEIKLSELVDTVARMLKTASDSKNIKIENNISGQSLAFADLQIVQAILRNLLSNAVKFTEPGGHVSIDSITKGGEIEVIVSDTGVGIPQKSLKNIFSPEAPVKTFGTNNESGSGLGLLLCKDFVEKCGGRIRAESTVGEGSTFYFTIPAK